MRRRPLSVQSRVMPEKIGLHADAEGEGVRLQWNRNSRAVMNADHATLLIQDGTQRGQLDLTGRQLDSSTVMYLPQSERVNFRLEVYRGSQSSSDSAGFELPKDSSQRRHQGAARAIVEQARPSPFEHTAPEIVVTQTLPPPVISVSEAVAPAQAAPETPKETRLDKFLSRFRHCGVCGSIHQGKKPNRVGSQSGLGDRIDMVGLEPCGGPFRQTRAEELPHGRHGGGAIHQVSANHPEGPRGCETPAVNACRCNASGWPPGQAICRASPGKMCSSQGRTLLWNSHPPPPSSFQK